MPPDKPQPTDQNDDSESSAGLLAPIIGLILVIGIAFVFLRSQQRGFPLLRNRTISPIRS